MRFSSPLRSRFGAWIESRGPRSDHAEPREASDPAEGVERPGAAIGMREEAPELVMLPWGPADAEGEAVCEVPGDFGEFELEYAAIRRAAGVMDMANRTVIRVTGDDRRDFLGRMLTQDLRTLQPGSGVASFLLNRKGRIEGDLYLIEMGDETLIDLDVHQVDAVADALSKFVIADDVRIVKLEGQVHRLAMHGRRAEALLDAAVTGAMPALPEGRAVRLLLAGVETIVFRRDTTSEPGFEFVVPRDAAHIVWDQLLSASVFVGDRIRRPRPIGWFAFNVARLEAGMPIFNIDFGSTSLPHESGVLHSRVSFRKGCYLGQEIVARMQSLGKPKQMLVRLEMVDVDEPESEMHDESALSPLPVSGTQVLSTAADSSGNPVGMITSSALSPLAGGRPVMLAVLRTAEAQGGRDLLTYADGEAVRCRVVSEPVVKE